MDKELLISNIRKYCAAKGEKPTNACAAAGVGKSFVSDIARGRAPSVTAIADLAAYLGVSCSDLVGDAQTPTELAPLAAAWAELNDEGRAALIQHANLLVNSGMYIKNHLSKEA